MLFQHVRILLLMIKITFLLRVARQFTVWKWFVETRKPNQNSAWCGRHELGITVIYISGLRSIENNGFWQNKGKYHFITIWHVVYFTNVLEEASTLTRSVSCIQFWSSQDNAMQVFSALNMCSILKCSHIKEGNERQDYTCMYSVHTLIMIKNDRNISK